MKPDRLLLLLACFAFAACSGKTDTPDDSLETIKATSPALKTTISDGVNVKWENGDEIAVFVSGGGTDESQCSAVYRTDVSSPASSATFVLINGEEAVRQDGCFKAVYPKSRLYKWESEGKKSCTMDLPCDQTVSGPGWDRSASLMASSSTTNVFVFTHCAAYLKFTITDDSPEIVSFTAASGADSEMLAARVEITIADDNSTTVVETTPTSLQRTSATLSMEGGGVFPQGSYYLAILPNTFSNGLVFTFTDVNGKKIERRVEEELVMEAGCIGNLGEVKKVGEGSSIEPLKPFDPYSARLRVSLVGDSITSFEGSLPEYFDANGAAYYPYGSVNSVTQQYWHKLIYGKMKSAKLDVNNSWRGSTVIRRDHPDLEGKDFCARVKGFGLGDPDVILIHGGTNDCSVHSLSYSPRPGMHRADMYPGITGMDALPTNAQIQQVYDLAEAATTWEDILDLEDHYFIQAYVKLLNMIHFRHPAAKVVVIIGDQLTQSARDALVAITKHYNGLYDYRYVDFFGHQGDIDKVAGVHPNEAGFTYMAQTIYDKVRDYIDK